MFRVRQQVGCTDELVASCNCRNSEDNIRVAVLDTGIGNHPDFEGRVDAFYDFLHGGRNAYDDSGHGTHVIGCIGGSGKASGGMYKGIAPHCRLVVGKVLDENGDGNIDHMKQGIEWVLDIKDRYKIRVLNISIGIGYIDNKNRMEELVRAVDEAWDSGIVVVCAAGNMGPKPMTISPLGASKKVITVGCHEGGYFGKRSSLCEEYSGRGPSPYAVKKPDVVAPGTDIISCNVACRQSFRGYRNAYTKKSGTSMATPIVSGAVALLLQKYPYLTNEQVKRKLSYSATDLQEPWTKQGWGMINVRRMLAP
ncbi:S8 family peptidase [Kineothrix sp. MB12-C1]|uniref:S8 family peptidase n=1 Tax=Kineothrix sp. MB12-C1 TaxID=3070215 RepID=UPI0027D260A0|nr:S8 family peptidase [Kineothrix sp. MB12-C1]WMC92451.1 S8 family peptidase [Kineothrix sp. MB12-C1]